MKVNRNSKFNQTVLCALFWVTGMAPTTATAGFFGEDDTLESDFNSRCKPLIELDENFKKENCANKPNNQQCKTIRDRMASLGGEQTLGLCVQGKVAMNASAKEETKYYTYMIASGTCSALAWTSFWTAGTNEIICGSISGAIGITGVTLDTLAAKDMNKAAEDYANSCKELRTDFSYKAKASGAAIGGLGAATTGLWHGIKGQGVKEASKRGFDGLKQKFGCLTCAGSFAILSGTSKLSQLNIENIARNSVDQANLIGESMEKQASNFTTTSNANPKDRKDTEKRGRSGDLNDHLSDHCLAAGNSGSKVEQCLANKIPEIAAILNHQPLMDQIKKTYNGKGLGDLIKEGKKQPKFDEYLAKTMGMPPQSLNRLMAMNEKFAVDSGLKNRINPTYASHTFESLSGGGSGSLKSDTGFGIKNTAPVASNLSDAAYSANDSNEELSLDPTEVLYRQLDLMSPKQIFESKHISLFVRAAHRYRKNEEKVEKPSSETQVRTPASVKK